MQTRMTPYQAKLAADWDNVRAREEEVNEKGKTAILQHEDLMDRLLRQCIAAGLSLQPDGRVTL